jgi:hypothetical protein
MLTLIRPTALALLLLALLPACASERWVYYRPNITLARLDQDLTACRKAALVPGRLTKIWKSERIDQDALNRCMERRGYTACPAGVLATFQCGS